MTKTEIKKQNYELLVNDYIQAKNQAQSSLLEYSNVITEALDKLGKKEWKKWLSDSRINLTTSQAYKFVAISRHCKNAVQLTGLLKEKHIEKGTNRKFMNSRYYVRFKIKKIIRNLL